MSSLQEAREAIQSGNLPAAQAIIADVLKSDQNNAEAWFLLSEATAGDRKLIFLNKAIAIDPTFQEAIDRKAELESPAEPEPEPEPEPTFEEGPEDELFEEFEEEEEDFLEVAPANFDDFSVADDDNEPEYVDPSPIESSPPAEDVTPSAVAETASKTSAVKKEDKEEESEPSNLLNNIGFAFSLSLSVVLLILFLRAFLSLF